MSLSHPNSDTSWASGVSWTPIPFDDVKHPMPVLGIADIDIMQTPTAEYFVVDILRQPANPLNLLSRYYVTPTAASGKPKWNPHDLATDISAGSITSCLGQRANDYVAGIYTMGKIGNTEELIYTPL
jgi:hypothetical protein